MGSSHRRAARPGRMGGGHDPIDGGHADSLRRLAAIIMDADGHAAGIELLDDHSRPLRFLQCWLVLEQCRAIMRRRDPKQKQMTALGHLYYFCRIIRSTRDIVKFRGLLL